MKKNQNNWDDESGLKRQRPEKKHKKFDRAIRTKDIDFLSDYDDDQDY